MVERTQAQGKGVKRSGGNTSPLKELADSTKKRRASMRLSSKTDAGTSNLTMTGSLLKSFRYRVIDRTIKFFIAGSYNNKKAGYVSKDRPFFNLAGKELRTLANFLIKLTRGK